VEVGPPPGRAALRGGSRDIPFTRRQINATMVYPNSTHGKVFFRMGGASYVCSGTVIRIANSRAAVITAGHCVDDPGGGWATSWSFAPGYRNGRAPLGVWPAKVLWTFRAWGVKGDFTRDVGIAVIGRRSGKALDAVVGARGLAWDLPRRQRFRAFGYPAAPPFNGEKLWVCESSYGTDDPFFDGGEGLSPMGIGCDMTGGSSGGGWVVRNRFVNSVNSYGYDGLPAVMFGPYFDSSVGDLYRRAAKPAG
jgi:hypothetical protein